MKLRFLFAQIALSALTVFLLPGCNAPTSSDDPANLSVLDAEAGKNQFNAYSFQQGEITPTGNPFDMAIVGPGLFILDHHGRKVFFRRPAKFLHDVNGHFILGNSEIHLQGIKLWDEKNPYADLMQSLPSAHAAIASQLATIHLPFQLPIPPKATQKLTVVGNLPADGHPKGSIIYTQRFLHHAEKDDLVVALSSSTGDELGMRPGDVLTLSTLVAATRTTESITFTVKSITTLNELAQALQAFLRGASVGAGIATTVETITLTDDPDLRGALTVYNNQAEIHNLQITSDRPISSPKVTMAFAFPSLIPARTTKLEATTDRLRYVPTNTDLVSELFDTNGNHLGLEEGDEVVVSGTLGGIPANHVAPLTYVTGANGTTLDDLMRRIKDNFKLPERDGTPANHASVSINAAASDDNIPDGALVIRGMPESKFALGSVVVTSSNANHATPTPNNFNANMNSTTLRDATDSFLQEVMTAVYDSMGVSHTLRLTFTSSLQPNEWLWKAEIIYPEGEWTKPSGILNFKPNGDLEAWTFNQNLSILQQVKSANATKPLSTLRIDLAPLKPTLTQYGTTPNPARRYEPPVVLGQDGYALGYLNSIELDGMGRIKGSFTNGFTRLLYLIPLADFPNKQGLKPVGANSFIESAASGSPAYFTGMSQVTGSLITSHIEAAPQ